MTLKTQHQPAKPRYLSHELPSALGLTNDAIAELITVELFPPSKCDLIYGPSWDRAEVDDFAQFLIEEFF